MSGALILLWSLLLACSTGPSDETLVDELRVLATLTDPPEAQAGETVSTETLVVDPADAGYDLLSWPCTFTGEGCAEPELSELSGEVWAGLSLEQGRSGTDRYAGSTTLSPALSEALSDTPVPLVQLWTLACEPGLCPVIDLAASSPGAGSAEAESLQAALSDPPAQLEALPMEGVSLAVRWLHASTRPEGERLVNPTISCEVLSQDTDEPVVAPGEALDFTCFLEGELTGFAGAWGYTTAGGWEGATYLLDPGVTLIDYVWFAPEEAPADPLVPLWVLVVDGEGGVGLWEGRARVEG